MVFVLYAIQELVDNREKTGYRSKDPAPDDYLSNIPFLRCFQNPVYRKDSKLISVQEKKTRPDKYKDYVAGFRHPGNRRRSRLLLWGDKQTAPNYRRYIHIIVEAPNGDYAAVLRYVVRPWKTGMGTWNQWRPIPTIEIKIGT